MDEFDRGKALAEIVNKYKYSLFDKVRILLFITLIPIFYFIFINSNVDITLLFFSGIYISFVSFVFIISEIVKFYYVKRREKDRLNNLTTHNLDSLLLMIPTLIFDPFFGFFSSTEFRQGFKKIYWATKLYYLIYITAFLIFIPFLLLAIYSLGVLFLSFIK